MIWFKPFEGFPYTELPVADALAHVQATPGYAVENLGVSSDGANPVIGLRRENPGKPYIVIDGGIHGNHEWTTVYWTREFARLVANPEGSQYRLLTFLRDNFSWYFIPMLNPYGYVNKTRWNGNIQPVEFPDGVYDVGVDLNRNFAQFWEEYEPETYNWGSKGTAPFSEVESQMLRDIILDTRPVAYVNCHTAGSQAGGKDYITAKGKEHLEQMGIRMVQNIKQVLGRDDFAYVNPVLERGQSHIWAAYQESSMGFTPYAHTLEAGGGESDEEQSRMGLNALTLISLYTYHWVYNRNMRPVARH